MSASQKPIEQLLREGIEAAQSGQKATARARLTEVTARDEKNEKGWLWLASVADNEGEKRVFLSNVLFINPNNDRAKSQLDALDRANGTSSGSGDAKPAGSRRPLLIGALVVIVLLLGVVFIVSRGQGGSSVTLTPAALAAALNGTLPGTAQGTADATGAATGDASLAAEAKTSSPIPVSATSAPTAVATITGTRKGVAVALVQNTLPPTWTPEASATSLLHATGTPLAAPPASVTGQLVAISGDQLTLDGYLPIVTMNPDGTNQQTIPINPDRGEYAIFMPDGQHLIYTYLAGGTNSRLMRYINANGSQPREVSSGWGNLPPLGDQLQASISANGKLLAFAAQNILGNEQYPGIYVLNMTHLISLANQSGDQLTATPTLTPAKNPTRTPSPSPTLSLSSIYLTHVTAPNIGINSWPSISPDGKTVVFATDTTSAGKNGTDLFIAAVKAESKAIPLTNDGTAFTEAAPVWSPDGRQIAFMAVPKGSTNNDIFLINADGSNRQTLVHLDNTNNIRPRWSPDGKYIAFSSDRAGKMQIYIIEVASKTIYQVTKNDVTNIVTDWGPAPQ